MTSRGVNRIGLAENLVVSAVHHTKRIYRPDKTGAESKKPYLALWETRQGAIAALPTLEREWPFPAACASPKNAYFWCAHALAGFL